MQYNKINHFDSKVLVCINAMENPEEIAGVGKRRHLILDIRKDMQ